MRSKNALSLLLVLLLMGCGRSGTMRNKKLANKEIYYAGMSGNGIPFKPYQVIEKNVAEEGDAGYLKAKYNTDGKLMQLDSYNNAELFFSQVIDYEKHKTFLYDGDGKLLEESDRIKPIGIFR